MSDETLLRLAAEAALAAGKAIMEVYSRQFEVFVKDDNSPVTKADLNASRIINDTLRPSQLPFVCEEDLHYTYAERRLFDDYWLVDPLDGTAEFVKRNGEFTVNIALVRECKPVMGVVYAPVVGTLWYSLNGVAYKIENVSEAHLDHLSDPSYRLARTCHSGYVVLVSRSHRTAEVDTYIDEHVRPLHGDMVIDTCGSSLKFAALAEGRADIYVCYSKTKEWDTAAAEAVLAAAGGGVRRIGDNLPLEYNKAEYANPPFVAFSEL